MLAQPTAAVQPSVPSLLLACWVSFLDFSWALWVCSIFLDFSHHPEKPLLIHPGLQTHHFIGCPGTCMTTNPPEDPDLVNLTFDFQGLSITVRGSSQSAASFIGGLANHSAVSENSHSDIPPSEPAPSSIPAERSLQSTSSETRQSIQDSFALCPSPWISLAKSQLGGSEADSKYRAERAWLAGSWAKATSQGRVSSPNRSETISQRNRYWCVVRCSACSAPAVFTTSNDFFRAVGRLEGSSTICHAFPSLVEARIYFAAAGEEYPGELQ